MITFMLITNDPELAKYAENCGVGRIFVDLERLGKKERQGHLDTLISQHAMRDVAKIRSCLTQAQLLVRLNPLHSGSETEVEQAINSGADLLMLPMFRNAEEVREFSALVNGRAGIIPLVETYAATECIDEVLDIAGVSEIYIGLNDLHIDMHLNFMFEPLANGLVDELARKIKAAGLPFGVGGIARVGEGIIPGELVLAEHLRLGSSSVILSRTFHRKTADISEFKVNLNLKEELHKLMAFEKELQLRSVEQEIIDQQRFQSTVAAFIAGKN